MSLRRTPRRIKHFLARYGPDLTRGVRDPRHRQGQRWSLGVLLETAWLGMVLACRTLTDVETKSARVGPRVPDNTLAYLLERLDPAPFRDQLVAQVRRQHRAKAYRPHDLPCGVCALDGKTTWVGAWRADPACQEQTAGAYHLRVLRAVLVSARSRPCLDQDVIARDTNDMGHFKVFWRQLVATYGARAVFEVVTLDAGFASKVDMTMVDDDGYGYVLNIKDNQPSLHAELVRLLATATAPPVATSGWETAHGGWIKRDLYRTAEIAGWDDWPHLRQGWLVRQTTRKAGTTTVEDRYFATNVLWNRFTPPQILRVVRAHWAIENDCNWVMDVVWKEDTHAWTANKRGLPDRWPLRVLMWLRLLAYNLLTWLLRVHLRAAGFRRMTWAALRDALEQVLLPIPSAAAVEVAFATLG